MASIESLRTFLQPHLRADLTEAYRSFRKRSGGDGLEAFLTHLHDQKLLPDSVYLEALARGEIEVTDLGAFRRAAPTTASAGATTQTVLRPPGAGPSPAPGGTPAAESGATTRDSVVAAPPAVSPGSTFPPGRERYELLGLVGEGGMGQVLLAKDLDLCRRVALKQLRPEVAGEAEVVGRFLTEVQITAQLDHPNVVPVYCLEVRPDGTLAYSMKLVRGRTLEEVIEESGNLHRARRPIDAEHSLPARLEHFLKVCDALAFAHSKGVIHRDLKPANIMIGAYNEVYVMDWGLARRIDAEDPPAAGQVELTRRDGTERCVEMTALGMVMGTPRYMSPEQASARNRELDATSDQYALGLILFEVVTLTKAVPGLDLREVLLSAAHGRKEAFVHLVAGESVPIELHAIVDKATALAPKDRYASVRDLAEDVRCYLRGEAVRARPDTRRQKLLRWMNRHREATLSLVLAAGLVAALATIWGLREGAARAAATREEERKISQFFTAVSQQSQRIDAYFLGFQESLDGLAAAAVQALTRGVPSDETIYWNEDFTTPGRQPPDLAESDFYRGRVSLDAPLWVLAPGVGRDSVLPELRRLNPLRHRCREILLAHRPAGTPDPADPAAERALLLRGLPLCWCYFGLADGALFLYPGRGHPGEGYDPRVRPWYRLSAGKRGKHWGNPYVDVTDKRLLLPCTTSLYDEGGRLLGVAGVEMTFDHLIDTLLTLPGWPAIQESSLVDESTRVVVDSRDRGKAGRLERLDQGLKLEPLGIPEVEAAIRTGTSGVVRRLRAGRPTQVGFYRLSDVGWYYVVEADEAGILAGK